MSRALITGAAGRAGTAAVEAFHAAGLDVTALVLRASDEVDTDRVVVGDAGHPAVVREALADVDVVVHLAALPSPAAGTAEEVFCGNTAATFTVLEQCAQAGIRHAVIASSQAISGLPFGPRGRAPAYVPVDEALPLQIADPYSLSKATDEAIAAMMWWRHGLSVCALRLPFLGDADGLLRDRALHLRADPGDGAPDLWAYLDLRDAAHACLLAAGRPAGSGTEIVLVGAPNSLAPYPTEWLLDAFLPHTPRRREFQANEVPLDLRRSRDLLGFEAQHVWEW